MSALAAVGFCLRAWLLRLALPIVADGRTQSSATMWRLLVALALTVCRSASEPWDTYMLSPGADRIQHPQHWLAHAAVPPQPNSTTPPPPSAPLPIRLSGRGDSIMFDWGQETGGFTILAFGDASDTAQSVSLAYR